MTALNAWLGEHAVALDSLDPDDLDPSSPDLAAITRLVGDARVVFVGESMHRIHEFLDVRHRIVRHLVTELGFTAFAMESGFAEARLVDDWIGGRSDLRPREVLERGLTYHMGKCQELLDQLAWMRRHNLAAARPLRFHGIDLSASAASARPAVEVVAEILDRIDPGYSAVVRETLLPRFDHLPPEGGLAWAALAIRAYLELGEPERFELTARIGALAERTAALAPRFAGTDDAEAIAFAAQAAATARRTDAFLAAMVGAAGRGFPPANVRDLAMAENIRWILRREPRIVVAAANGHVQRSSFVSPPLVPEPQLTFGQHLADELRGHSVVIASTYGGGDAWLHRPSPDDAPGESTPFVEAVEKPRPRTLDAAIAAGVRTSGTSGTPGSPGAMPPGFLVDLRDAPAGGPVRDAADQLEGTAHGPYVLSSAPFDAFDSAVHVDRITPWHTWLDAHGRS
ncbi:erythromycin esterase family protein [Agromyces sp. MMS24-K17]|uniref:erythromycin esterase family protein n=1 Tax=Agromyces sp. MMS24-K17 TaxID=3372850 RepID=UPI0037553102